MSVKIIWPRESVYIPLIAFLVVFGVGEVIETLLSHIVLIRVDFPTDGRPITAVVAHFVISESIAKEKKFATVEHFAASYRV